MKRSDGMVKVKSISVGNGDMYYIKHGSDNFTIIDCCLSEDNKDDLISEIIRESKGKGIKRFISTHPDEDHIRGLEDIDNEMSIGNFYCVENEARKEDETSSFRKYCELRDSDDKAFYISKGCSRNWMNRATEERSSAGIHVLWPILDNEHYKAALDDAKNMKSPNNISPIVKYSLEDGVTMLWMGDLELDFLNNIKDDLELPSVDILFAPHHGRDSGKVPKELLDILEPKIVVIGEGPSEDLNYYNGYNTITQNSAKDIIFDCYTNKVHIYVSNENYSGGKFLDDENMNEYDGYIGTLTV